MLPFLDKYYPGGTVGANITTELTGYVVSQGCQQFDWGLLPEFPDEAGIFTVHGIDHSELYKYRVAVRSRLFAPDSMQYGSTGKFSILRKEKRKAQLPNCVQPTHFTG